MVAKVVVVRLVKLVSAMSFLRHGGHRSRAYIYPTSDISHLVYLRMREPVVDINFKNITYIATIILYCIQ